jgi:hypothetical protein
MRLFRRKRLFIDARVQSALLMRIVVYWFLNLLTVSLLLICWQIIDGPAVPLGERFDLGHLWHEHASVLLALLMTLPIILLDSVILSHRFVGPFFRIRSAIRTLKSGATIEPLRFRDKDFWQDVARDLNDLSIYFDQQRARLEIATANHQNEVVEGEPELQLTAAR